MSRSPYSSEIQNKAGVRTRWCVITGAPCSGKTTVINELAKKGFEVVPESARAFIEDQLAHGLSLAEIRADLPALEQQILLRKIRTEGRLPIEKTIFLDRAVPDSIAYFIHAGLDPTEPEKASRRFRYRRIFFLDRLPCETDTTRVEDDATAAALEAALEKSYTGLGYFLTRIPVLPVKQRVDLILQQI